MRYSSEKTKIILVVDDDEDDRKIFREALESLDVPLEYREAEDGDAALRLLATPGMRLPDFIFLDLNMPRKDGRQCLTEIKTTERLQDIPVIIYTTSRQSADEEETRRLGAEYFITKPLQFEDICRSIRHVLDAQWK